MDYAITEGDGTLVVRARGRLDSKGVPALEAGLEGKLDHVSDLTIDLRDVDYVSSLGLRLLLSLQKRMFKQGAMRVINVCDDVMHLLDDTGFSEFMAVSAAE